MTAPADPATRLGSGGEAAEAAPGTEAAGATASEAAAAADRRALERWAATAAAAADDRKGVDTMVIDVGDMLAVTELFVITHGNNARQVRSIAEGVEERLKAEGGPSPLRIEGAEERQWVLLDYGDFVVHVFDADRRALYQLERLWGDCPIVAWQSVFATATRDSGDRPR